MMRIQLFIAGLILWLHISICNVWSQNNIPRPPVTLPSPNVASLGQYGNYPVSYFTGVPQITIPIYELQEKNLHVPISLSYHASGFRPDQHPGWVGLGWSLQAGGVITRQVNDLKDEYDNPNFYQGEKAGYYYNSSVLNRSDWNQTSYLQMVTRSNDNLCLKDTEPDEFSFSLPSGTSGKFYRTHTGKWKVSCDRPISVEVTTTSLLEQPFTPPYESLFEKYGYKYTKTFAGFSITDENGIKYIFGSNGSTTNAIEYSIGFFKQNIDEWTATSWYLTTIQHPNGEKIDFTYERDSFIAQMYISVYKDIITRVVGHSGLFNPRPSCQSSSGTIPIGMYYSGELISPVYLSEVSTTNVKVKFIRTNTTELRYAQSVFDWQYYLEYFINLAYPSFLPFLEDNGWSTYPTCLSKLQWKKLDQVRIEENKVLQKAFNFDYSKNINQRLTLLSLTEQGGSDNLLKPAYVFSYDTSVPLPDYLKNTSDHWGFYNGTYAYIDSVNAYYNYREAKAGYLLAGTLNKIKYPTGGITDFLFEPNQYSQQAADNRENAPVMYEQDKIAGGLRIRKISSYDSLRPQEKVEKEYYYVKDYTGGSFANFRSSGILGGQIKYYFDDYRATAFNDDKVTYSKSIFSSQSVLPGNYNSQGSHIGYSEIIEKLSDGSYTKYTYSNLDNAAYRDLAADNSLQPNRIIYQPYANREMNRGKLLSEQNYNSTNKLLRSRIINYQQIGTDTEVRALRALYFNVCPNTAVSVEEATAYKFLTHSFLPINEQITVYQ